MTPFKQANDALRENRFEAAIALYVQSLQAAPALAQFLLPNLKTAQGRYRKARGATQQPVVIVTGWNLAQNAAGRVITLAQLYQPLAKVEIIGCFFPKWGYEVWQPIRSQPIPIHSIAIEDESQFIQQATELVLKHPCDVLHLSKPRAPNILIGLLYKLIWNAHVIVDIDDEELAFVSATAPITLNEYLKAHNTLPDIRDLTGETWTRIGVGLATAFDGITVANSALQQRYAGTIVRHARNEKLFVPSTARSKQNRAKLNIPESEKVVLFLGTPRQHKGLLDTAKAAASLKRPDVRLVIVGDFPKEVQTLKAEIQALPNLKIQFIGDQAFDSVPDIVSVGDICVLLQDPDSLAAQFQTPAKLSDALAMGLTVLAEITPGLADLAEQGALRPVTRTTLAAELAKALSEPVRPPVSHPLFATHLSMQANRAPLAQWLTVAQRSNAVQLTATLQTLAQKLPSLSYLSPQPGNSATPPKATPPAKTPAPAVAASKSIEATIRQVNAAMAQDDWRGAYEHWRSLLARPDSELSIDLLLRISRELFKLDAFPEAAIALQRAVNQNPSHPNLICEQAQQYYYHCYSSWLMLVTENEPDWYKADGLEIRPDWKTACDLIEKAEKVAPRNNLRRYVQAYLLLAEDAWDNGQREQAQAALHIAIKAIGPNALDIKLIQAIIEAVDQIRDNNINESDPYNQALQERLTVLPIDFLGVQDWLCLNDILNWNGLLLCGYVAREKAVDRAIALGKTDSKHKEQLKAACRAAFDRGDTAIADDFLTKLKTISPDAVDVRELESYCELMKGNVDAFRQKWPHPPTPAEQRLREYLKGKSVAVVGPAPTGTLDGKEIDSFDVVVRMNWRGPESLTAPNESGCRTDISIYNAHSIRLAKENNQLSICKDLIHTVIRRKRHDKNIFFEKLKKLCVIEDYLPLFYKSANAAPLIIAQLVLAEVKSIKLFNFDFYAGTKHHADGYRAYCGNDNKTSSLRLLQPVLANHDLIAQLGAVSLVAKGFHNCKLQTSISQLLYANRKDYLKQLSTNIVNNHRSKPNSHLPHLKLKEDIYKLKEAGEICISIVGNSPILKDSGLGVFIDNSNVVIRLNNYVTKGYEDDVGSKADFVLITPATLPNVELKSISTHKVLAFCNDKFEDLNIAQNRINLDNGCKVILHDANILDIGIVNRLTKELNLKDRQWPSTGMLAIAWCLEVFGDINITINLFGFSFFKESGNGLQHYYGIETKRDKHHDFLAEENFVAKLQDKGKLNLVSSRAEAITLANYSNIKNRFDPNIVIASHYEKSRSSSPCVSVYHGFLDNDNYRGKVSHLYTKSSREVYQNNLELLLKRKQIFLFNGICSYLQDDFVVDSFEKIIESGSPVGVYWHETAWNINKFRNTWKRNWDKSIEIFKNHNCFHLVPTSQNKQLVMLLTDVDIEKIRVVFETIPDLGRQIKQRLNRKKSLKIIGSGIPDERKGFDIFKRLSEDPVLSNFQFIWHWHEDVNKVKKRFNGIGKINYCGFVEDFGAHLAKNADLFLLTSRDDPSPIVALEALRSDVPVICFDSTGYAEILPKEFVARSYADMRLKILQFSENITSYDSGFFYDLFEDHSPVKFLEKANLKDFY
jgi:glycosyltransferase involved in cell wall biosynthesis